MSRTLTTCEQRGTRVSHKKVDSKATIVGSYYGGFVLEQVGRKFMLPFERVDQWNVIEVGE